MKTFEHYCKTLHCKMSNEPCIGRQLLAVKPHIYRLNTQSLLVSQGFYPECYSCDRGRRLATSLGINIRTLREQLIEMRRRIEESAQIFYGIHPRSR
jgi:hypothetical protein